MDLAKTAATFCVILIHVTGLSYDLTWQGMADKPFVTRLVVLGCGVAGRLGVPIFMFLSGYLLLDRTYDRERTVSFWKNNLLRLLLATEFWIIVYHFFSLWISKKPFRPDDLILDMAFYRTTDAVHLWYMGQILGLYLFIPVIARVLQVILDKRTIVILWVVSFCYIYIHTTVNVFRDVAQLPHLVPKFNVSFSGGCYGLMLVLGWMVKQGYFRRIRSWVFGMAFVESYGVLVALELYAYRHKITYNVWYDSGLLLVAAFCLLMLLIRIKRPVFPAFVRWTGQSGFGVYAIHYIFCMYLDGYLDRNYPLLAFWQKGVVMLAAVIVLSNLFVWVLSRIRPVGRVLFYMKR